MSSQTAVQAPVTPSVITEEKESVESCNSGTDEPLFRKPTVKLLMYIYSTSTTCGISIKAVNQLKYLITVNRMLSIVNSRFMTN